VPVTSKVDIVVPLRDSPGITAMPCIIPTAIADLYVISFSFGLTIVAAKSIIAVTMKVIGRIL